MTDAREPARFFEHALAGRRAILRVVPQQFQRDVAVQLRIPRAVDLARDPLADPLEQQERSPPPDGIRARLHVGRLLGRDGAVQV